MANLDRNSVISRIREYLALLDELITMIGEDKPFLPLEERKIAQAKYQQLKQRLRKDRQRGMSERGWARLSEQEKNYLHPAVSEALSELGTPTNTSPVWWPPELLAAKERLNHFWQLAEMEAQEHKKEM